ncbi:MAG: LapA family protein [Pseudomonadota bacterium]
MRKLLSTVFLGLLGLALIIFFVANRQPVLISFDPISPNDPAIALGPWPMFALPALTLFVGFFLGLFAMWLSDSSLRQKARERKREIKRLKTELDLAASAPTAGTGKAVSVRS